MTPKSCPADREILRDTALTQSRPRQEGHLAGRRPEPFTCGLSAPLPGASLRETGDIANEFRAGADETPPCLGEAPTMQKGRNQHPLRIAAVEQDVSDSLDLKLR